MRYSRLLQFTLSIAVFICYIKEVTPSDDVNQIIYEWKHDIIGNIKFAKITEDNEIIVQNYRNQVMKFDIQGNLAWSTSSQSAQLIKIQTEWIILFDSSSQTLVYLSINTGENVKNISFDAFKKDLPHMKSSNKVFLMYDTNTIFWVVSSQASEKAFSSFSYELPNNYRILNVSISKDSEIYLLVQYKERKMCITRTAVLGQNSKLEFLRCRQTVFNQPTITHSSLSGFIIRDQSAGDHQPVIRLVFFGLTDIPEEEFYVTRYPLLDILSFDQSEIVIFKYASYFEVCRFAPQELICPEIYIKKQPYHFVPTFNSQQILLLSSNEVLKEGDNKQLSLQLLDLNTYHIIEYEKMHFIEPITFVYANPKIFNSDMKPSISLFVQTTKRQAIFAELYVKQLQTHRIIEGSLEGEMSPVFYRYDNIVADPYPLEQPLPLSIPLADSLLVASKVLSRVQHRWKTNLNTLMNSIVSIDYQNLLNWKDYKLISNDSDNRLYGIEKIILIPSKHFRLFAFNSSSGKQIYSTTIQGQTDTNEVVGITSMALDSNGKKGYLLVINNSDNVVIQTISPETGDIIDQAAVHFEEGDRFQSFSKARLIENSKIEHLLIFSSKQKVKFYPSLRLGQSTQLNIYLHSNKVIWLHQETNSVSSFMMKSTYESLEKISVFALKPNQRIIKIAQNLFRFNPFKLQQSIIPIESNGKDSYRSLDLEGKVYALLSLNQADKRLTLFLIVASTSQVLFEKHMANVRVTQPIDLIMYQNMLYVSFFSEYYSKQIIFEMKFYYRIFLTVFDLPSPQLPLENLVCDTKTIFSEQTISRFHAIVRDTHLVFTNFNSDIISLDLKFFNQTQSSQILFNSTFRQINTFPLSDIQSVYVDSTSLSSRFIIFANGAQLYSFSFFPDGSFDTLPLDFNYQGVIISVIVCIIVLFISLCINSIRRQKEKRKIY